MEAKNEDLMIIEKSLNRFKSLNIESKQAKNKKVKAEVERDINLELSSLNRKVNLKNYDLGFESDTDTPYLIHQLEEVIEIIKSGK